MNDRTPGHRPPHGSPAPVTPASQSSIAPQAAKLGALLGAGTPGPEPEASAESASNVVSINGSRAALHRIHERLLGLRGTCPTHGDWPLHVMDEAGVLRDVPECPACMSRTAAQEARQHCFSGVQDRFADASFENFETPTLAMVEAHDAAQAYVAAVDAFIASGRSPARLREGALINALMIGTPGTGKTHLGVACMRALAEKGRVCRYARADQVVDAMHYGQRRSDGWRPQDGEIEPAIPARDLLLCDFLVIDEVGRFPMSPLQQSMLFRMIDSRSGSMRSTLLISNAAGEDQLESLITPAGFDRIRDGATIIPMHWRSHRRHAP